MQYHTLKNLALQEIGKCVSRVFDRRIVVLKKYPEDGLEKCFPEKAYLDLEEYVHKNIPASLANEWSEVIIKIIILTLEPHWKYHFEKTWGAGWNWAVHYLHCGAESHDSYSEFVNRSTDLAVEIACAATHKSLTTFKYDHTLDKNFQIKYLRKMLLTTNNFKEIILDKMPFSIISASLPNLKCWSSEEVTFEVVRDLTATSERLEILNLHSHLWDNSFDFIVRFQNLSQLNINQICFLNQYSEENFFQKLGTKLKSLAVLIREGSTTLISRYLLNITSLEITLYKEANLMPLKDLKYLASLAIMSYNPTNFAYAQDLIQEIGSRLLVLKLNLVQVNFKFIASHCRKLESFVYCFDLSIENLPYGTSGALSRYFSSEILTVKNLELRLKGAYVWDCFPYILNCFPNVQNLKLCLFRPPSHEYFTLPKNIIEVWLRKFDELILNDNKVEIHGKCGFITSGSGYAMTVTLEDLEQVLKDIFEGIDIPRMGRKFIVIPRPKFIFPVRMLDP